MDIKELYRWIPKIYGQIKNQIGEKVQFTESGQTIFPVNLFGKQEVHVTINFPQGTDPQEIGKIFTADEPRVIQDVEKDLRANEERVATLTEDKQMEFLARSTLSSISSNISILSMPPSKAALPSEFPEGSIGEEACPVLTFPNALPRNKRSSSGSDEGETV